MHKLILAFLTVCLLAGLPVFDAAQARTESIAAVVNEDAISESDVNDRMKMVIASSGLPDNREIRERMRPQILNTLIEERLRVQEAVRLEIEITPEDITQGFAAIARQNNYAPEQFRAILARQGVPTRTMEDQIRAQIAWSQVVQVRLRPQVLIADNEIEAELARLRGNIGKTEYRVLEIFLAVENPAEEGEVKRLADQLTRQLNDGRVPFQRLAAQVSQSAGAARGGDLGWVQEGQLAEEIEAQLARMDDGALSRPVRTLAGYHILYLRDTRQITAESIPSEDNLRQKIGMERLDRLQRRYLMDLKTAAFIEQRV